MKLPRGSFIMPGPGTEWYLVEGIYIGSTNRGTDQAADYFVSDQGHLVIYRYDGPTEGGYDPTYIESIAHSLVDEGERDIAVRLLHLMGVSLEVPL